MKPFDPRLLRHARSARRYVALTAVLGVLTAALVVGEALLIAHVLGPVVDRTADLPDVAPLLVGLAAILALRPVVAGAQERFGHRAATRTIAELREATVVHAAALGPRWPADGDTAAVAGLLTRGLDALDPYFVRYLPQLFLVATVTPGLLAVILGLDPLSALIVTVTLPLVPVFMILIGKLTEAWSARRMKTMTRLGAQILDLIVGLPTLRALGRERGPADRVRTLGRAHARATMGTLRVAFLSGMVLELVTTLSVAVVAVEIGLRLVAGNMDLTTGLAVLVLAPEVYLPLRQVGAHFHASADGLAAAGSVFTILAEPAPEPGTAPAPDLRRATIELRGVGVRAPGRARVAPADLSCALPPGRITALAGPNGAGKTTAAQVILGLLRPDAGTVVVREGEREVPLEEIDPETWWPQIAWVPQHPVLLPGTVLENVTDAPGPQGSDDGAASDAGHGPSTTDTGPDRKVTGADPDREATGSGRPVPSERLAAAARATGWDRVVADLPQGWDTPIGHGGVGLSLGQRQRLALTRALAADRPLVVLDEPTAHLAAEDEIPLLGAVEHLTAQRRTVLLIAHRPGLLATAGQVVTVHSRETTEAHTPGGDGEEPATQGPGVDGAASETSAPEADGEETRARRWGAGGEEPEAPPSGRPQDPAAATSSADDDARRAAERSVTR